MAPRHIGQGLPFFMSTSAQSPHANWWPQGTATCDLVPMKQIEQVVPPPKVEVSSTMDGRPSAAAVGAITVGISATCTVSVGSVGSASSNRRKSATAARTASTGASICALSTSWSNAGSTPSWVAAALRRRWLSLFRLALLCFLPAPDSPFSAASSKSSASIAASAAKLALACRATKSSAHCWMTACVGFAAADSDAAASPPAAATI
eukprot:scaffold11579_cov58-Phaeocystis_antarctica.AAC.3